MAGFLDKLSSAASSLWNAPSDALSKYVGPQPTNILTPDAYARSATPQTTVPVTAAPPVPPVTGQPQSGLASSYYKVATKNMGPDGKPIYDVWGPQGKLSYGDFLALNKTQPGAINIDLLPVGQEPVAPKPTAAQRMAASPTPAYVPQPTAVQQPPLQANIGKTLGDYAPPIITKPLETIADWTPPVLKTIAKYGSIPFAALGYGTGKAVEYGAFMPKWEREALNKALGEGWDVYQDMLKYGFGKVLSDQELLGGYKEKVLGATPRNLSDYSVVDSTIADVDMNGHPGDKPTVINVGDTRTKAATDLNKGANEIVTEGIGGRVTEANDIYTTAKFYKIPTSQVDKDGHVIYNVYNADGTKVANWEELQKLSPGITIDKIPLRSSSGLPVPPDAMNKPLPGIQEPGAVPDGTPGAYPKADFPKLLEDLRVQSGLTDAYTQKKELEEQNASLANFYDSASNEMSNPEYPQWLQSKRMEFISEAKKRAVGMYDFKIKALDEFINAKENYVVQLFNAHVKAYDAQVNAIKFYWDMKDQAADNDRLLLDSIVSLYGDAGKNLTDAEYNALASRFNDPAWADWLKTVDFKALAQSRLANEIAKINASKAASGADAGKPKTMSWVSDGIEYIFQVETDATGTSIVSAKPLGRKDPPTEAENLSDFMTMLSAYPNQWTAEQLNQLALAKIPKYAGTAEVLRAIETASSRTKQGTWGSRITVPNTDVSPFDAYEIFQTKLGANRPPKSVPQPGSIYKPIEPAAPVAQLTPIQLKAQLYTRLTSTAPEDLEWRKAFYDGKPGGAYGAREQLIEWIIRRPEFQNIPLETVKSIVYTVLPG